MNDHLCLIDRSSVRQIILRLARTHDDIARALLIEVDGLPIVTPADIARGIAVANEQASRKIVSRDDAPVGAVWHDEVMRSDDEQKSDATK